MSHDPLKDLYGGFGVGQKIQLQLSATAPRLSTVVVGMRPGHYIIVQRPETSQSSGFTDTFFYEAPVLVRYVYEGVVIGFRSQVDYVLKEPDHLLFLKYPSSVDQFSLRVSKRVDCFFTGEIKIKGMTSAIAVIDISREGCRVMASPDDEAISSLLLEQDEHDCSLFFATRETESWFEFPSLVKHTVKDSKRLVIGVQFKALPDGLNELITHYMELVE